MDTDKTPAVEAANNLISTVDRMQTDGVSAPLRLQYLCENGPAPLPSFDLTEHLAQIEALERLSATLTSARGEWRGAPMDAAYRDAGLALFEHLERLVDEHRNISGRSEIEMLSSLWESAPDVTGIYPWLHAPPRGLRLGFHVSSEPVSARASRPDASPEAPADLIEDAARESVAEAPPAEAPPAEEAPRAPVRVRGMEVHSDGEDVGDGTVVKTLKPGCTERVVPRIPDALAIKNWTDALNEATAAGWALVAQQPQLVGTILQWVRPDGSGSAVLRLWETLSGITHVRLELVSMGTVEVAEAKVSAAEIEALHADPAPFIRTLQS